MHPVILYIYIIVWVFISLITYFLYAFDKYKASKNQWRIKEKTLLIASFLFGSIGGLMGLYIARHKTKHWYFVVVNWVSFMIHLSVLIYLYTLVGVQL